MLYRNSFEFYQTVGYVSRSGGDALCKDGGWFAGDLSDEERRGVGTAELKVAAKFFGVDINAPFLDFKLTDARVAR